MNRFYSLLAISSMVPLLLTSCAGLTDDQQRKEADLRQQLKYSQRDQAELRRRLEELQNRFEMMETRIKTLQSQLKSLEAKGYIEPGLGEPPLAAEKRLQEQDITSPSAAAAAPPPSPAKSAPVASPPPAPPPAKPAAPLKPVEKIEITVVKEDPKTLYDEAYRTYSSGRSLRARSLFQDFYRQFPQDRLAPNALYWLGECYYDQRDYQEAMATFQKVAELYPQSSKVPDALYKKAICHLDLKQESLAVQELKNIVGKYPRSEAAKLAQEKLSRLRAGSQYRGR